MNLDSQQTGLTQKVQAVQSQYAAVKNAASISTSSWKQFCDQFAPFCFKYPMGWIVDDNSVKLSGDDREFATITDPNKTVLINYDNPLIKDGGSLSARIVGVNDMVVSGSKLAIIGIIPVASGVYDPSYIILPDSPDRILVPSKNAISLLGSINPRFTIGMYDSILFTGGATTKITSYAQAQAWFSSVDGKTVLKVLQSLSAE